MITPTLDLERILAAQGYDLIAGFDEVGRGALAGPVMVGCAAIWARDLEPLDGDDAVELSGRTYLGVPDGVADSKMLTEHRREAIFDELRDWCAAYAVGQASNAEIDEWGITYALGVAALRALSQVERELGLRLGGESTIKKASGESAGEIVEGRPGGSVGESIGNCGGSVRALPKVAGILDGPSGYITKALNTFDGRADSSRHNDQSQRRPALRHRRHRGGHRQSDPRPADGRPRAKQPTLRRLRMGS